MGSDSVGLKWYFKDALLFSTPHKMNVFGVYWNQPVYLSIHVSVHPCVCLCPSVYPSEYKILVSVKALAGILTLSQTTNFTPFQIANDNSKFDENGVNFSRRIENTVGKGEIACYEEFLLFPPCF